MSRNVWLAGVVVVSVLPFLPCMYGKFVYDDNRVVFHPVVEGELPWSDAFTTDFWGLSMSSRYSHKSYRPLAILSFRLSALLFGNTESFSYHVVNMVAHCVNCLLVWKLTALLSASVAASGIAAVVFAVHPLHTETVGLG